MGLDIFDSSSSYSGISCGGVLDRGAKGLDLSTNGQVSVLNDNQDSCGDGLDQGYCGLDLATKPDYDNMFDEEYFSSLLNLDLSSPHHMNGKSINFASEDVSDTLSTDRCFIESEIFRVSAFHYTFISRRKNCDCFY